jgi:hypothetical protein
VVSQMCYSVTLCQKRKKKLSKSWPKRKKVVKKEKKVVRKFSKKFSKSCQKVAKSCQKVVKKLSLFSIIQCFLCVSIHDIGGFRRRTFNDVGREGEWVGWVKKCFLGLRQTALLSEKYSLMKKTQIHVYTALDVSHLGCMQTEIIRGNDIM